MANNFTGLLPLMFEAVNEVSRELVGMIPSVMRSTEARMTAKGQSVTVPVVGRFQAEDIVPANISSTGSDIPASYENLIISKSRKVDFHVTGEEVLGLKSENEDEIFKQSLMQGMRTLTNEIENDLCGLAIDASRAYGTAGSTPFAMPDELSDIGQIRRILDENGTPMNGRSLVLNTAASANLRSKQPSVFRVNEHGSPMARRMGALGELFGMDIGESSQFSLHTKGRVAGTFAINNAAGYPVGTTSLIVDGTGVGDTVKAGDVVTFAGDDNRYIVAENASGAFSTLEIEAPGLLETVANDVQITIGNNYTPNLAFSRDAFLLGVRPPAMPSGGDAATDREMVMDQHSTLIFEICEYKQYKQTTFEVGIAWGVKTLRSEHAAILLG